MKVIIDIGDEEFAIDIDMLELDLMKGGFHIVSISYTGELVIGDESGKEYFYIARGEGSGTDNEYWGWCGGGGSPGWEFYGSTNWNSSEGTRQEGYGWK